MSKLEELIKVLCPNGVDSYKLKDIAQYCKNRIAASVTNKDNYVGVENLIPNKGGKTTSSVVPTSGQVISFSVGDILIGNIRPYLKKIWLADCNGGTNGDVLAIHITDNRVIPKFLYYELSSDSFFLYDMQNAKGSKMPRGSKEAVMQYTIPVPPIPVQEEIVRILDSFTELTAELTARKKQYEYYCNELLDIRKTDAIFKTLGELSKFRRGSFPQPYGNAEWYDGEGAMPFVQVADIGEDMRLVADTKRKISTIAQPKSVFAPSGSIIISLQGSIGRIAVTQYDAYIDRTVAIFQDISKEILPKYFVYQLQRIFAIKEKTARGSTIKTITKEEFAPFSIAVPPIDEQQRIVDVLDKFHNLCHDISEGLPAEIEARKKQYAFYRDKLLSFKETPTYEQKKEVSKTE